MRIWRNPFYSNPHWLEFWMDIYATYHPEKLQVEMDIWIGC